ncbi:hypothetical protein IMAU40088_00647 [Lactobacillus helveticus]|uniref:SLAP domain-containing protein n=1 Tax=Lactobacillus helveticus TaxID=1587 RepID=UPI0015622173|nr:SLAP domain-containing protein [Lactobacillus helveticus]NRO63979.1 hypothetical protein [Lactobacillus helveticus]
MKLKQKIVLTSVATLMAVTPAAGMLQPSQMAYAATNKQQISQKDKLKLNHNAYIYNKQGKHTKKLLRKGALVKYQGKISQNDFADNLYFYQNYSNTHRYQLTITKIKGTDYFKIGKNQYVKAANVDAIDGNKLLFNQTTVTVKTKTPQLFKASRNRALTTGKYYKKGQKLVVDQLGGIDVLANGFPNAYHIKGTDYYIWARDVTARQNMDSINYAERNGMVVLAKKDKIPFYSFTGQNITPNNFAWMRSQGLRINGAIYLWNEQENKAELYYHVVDRYQKMANLKTSPGFPEVVKINTVNIGDAFVKVSDVTFANGLHLKPINSASQAEDNAKIAMSESEELDLKDLINKHAVVQGSIKYKLSSFYKRYNYDQAIDEARSALDKGTISATQAQYLIWNIKTAQDELDGAKVKVGNLNKLTQDERLAIELLVSNIYSKETDTESLYGQVTMSEADESVFELSIENERDHNKVVSTKMMKTSDFAEER